ncbi:putative ATP-grasp-modified RiPP [Nonomuraea sp. NPDC049028]|uniref:putative ATP-grasp-modified RiPP n=1 Tax=Nonomuraea sp. NPDC049028 TaxID=3364348 RepID=UPI00371EAF2C
MQGESTAIQPWGVSRMSPYPDVIEFPEYTVIIDPATQIGRYVGESGVVVEMKHKKSNTGTEQKTRASKGDGSSPKAFDEDTSQDSDQD